MTHKSQEATRFLHCKKHDLKCKYNSTRFKDFKTSVIFYTKKGETGNGNSFREIIHLENSPEYKAATQWGRERVYVPSIY